MRVAFLTIEDRSGFVFDDALAITELARRGIAVDEVPWQRPADWRAFDGVVVRTTWDYQHHLDRFLAVLDHIEELGVPLANPAPLVRWNARKHYLCDLAARGVAIVPTRWGRGLAAAEVRALPELLGAAECVIKPVVSGNAWGTFRVTAETDADQLALILAHLGDREWMAQPFVRSILDRGEDSLVFFDGELSHAVRKRPRPGDYRVQEEHGGLIEPSVPAAAVREAAEGALAALGPPPLQARVDLVELDDGSLALMELEAIEPSLYLRKDARAPAAFARAVERWLARERPGQTRPGPD